MGDGLNLGQIAFPASHLSYRPPDRRRRQPREVVAPVKRPSGAAAGAPPMFAFVAGQTNRPLSQRSSVPLLSSAAQATLAALGVVLLMWSEQIILPNPNQSSRLVAMLVAAPPPPPPPATAAAPAAPAAATSDTRPEAMVNRIREIPMVTAPLDLPTLPPEERPELRLAAAPQVSNSLGGNGWGSAAGSGFGVEGGVGFGSSLSQPGTEPVRVGGAISTPELVHRVEPTYPPDAVAARLEGTVVVEATVDDQGRVRDVKILRSLGALDQAAINAVMQWRYSPLRVNDVAAHFLVTVNVTFRLH